MKKIGVLGGMGPESTARFYLELIKACQKQYGAKYDEDYPEIFIYNLPILDVVEGIKDMLTTLKMISYGARKLEEIGTEFLVMPCNTAHFLYEDVSSIVNIPFLSIIEETAKKLSGFKKVGLIATETTIKKNLYVKTLEEKKTTLVVPKDQETVTSVISNLLAGKKFEGDKKRIEEIIGELKIKGGF